jgi:hypothetical protein
MQVVELGQDNQRLKDAAEKASCRSLALTAYCKIEPNMSRCWLYILQQAVTVHGK